MSAQDLVQNELNNTKISLEAHKQMLNEQLQANIALRSNLIHFQQALQEANQKVEQLTKQVVDLTPKPVEPDPA